MSQCIIVFDDDAGAAWPLGWDADCEGAVCGRSAGTPVAVFPDARAARKAIAVSAAYARLCAAQGKPVTTDFTEARKYIRVVKLAGAP